MASKKHVRDWSGTTQYARGCKAWRDGAPLIANPYEKNTPGHKFWADGWLDALWFRLRNPSDPFEANAKRRNRPSPIIAWRDVCILGEVA